MMGIPCDFPAYIYSNNQYVLDDSENSFPVFKNKPSSIAYHFFREGGTKYEWLTTYIRTTDNVADLHTKPLASCDKRIKFTNMILHHIM